MSIEELESLMPVLTAPGSPDFAAPALRVRESFGHMLAASPIRDGLIFEQGTVGGVSGVWAESESVESGRVVLYLHGGGYVAGSAEGYRGLGGLIAAAAGGRTFLPDYRLAPEHLYPAALEDAVSAYRGLLDSGHRPEAVTIAGDSAGGGLAAATVIGVLEAALPAPGALVLISPWADLRGTGTSLATKAAVDPLLSPAGLSNCAEIYLGTTDPTESGASPIFGDFTGFPPLLIEVGTREVLLSDAIRLAERAAEANVEVTLHTWQGMVHVFPSLWFALSEGPAAIAEIGTFIREHTA